MCGDGVAETETIRSTGLNGSKSCMYVCIVEDGAEQYSTSTAYVLCVHVCDIAKSTK